MRVLHEMCRADAAGTRSLVRERAVGPVAEARHGDHPRDRQGAARPPGQAPPQLQRRREPAPQAHFGAIEQFRAAHRPLGDEGEPDQDHDFARDHRNRIGRDADADDDDAADVERDVHALGVARPLALAVQAQEALARRRLLELVKGFLGRVGHRVVRANASSPPHTPRPTRIAPARATLKPAFLAILAAP